MQFQKLLLKMLQMIVLILKDDLVFNYLLKTHLNNYSNWFSTVNHDVHVHVS